MASIEDTIAQVAGEPAQAQNAAGESVTQQSIPDLIAADRYLLAKACCTNPIRALRSFKILPPGAG